jgi:predicted transcriptional regulator
MAEIKNSEVIGGILRTLYMVASRRTSQTFAATVIGAIIKTLEQNYDFLRYINIENPEYTNSEIIINISNEIDTVEPTKVGTAVEAIIRIVYMDLVGKTGLFFMKELKEHAGEQIITELRNYGVDLAILQTEQRYMHRQHRKKKQQVQIKKTGEGMEHQDDVSLLGYSWKNVGSWKYDPLQKTCVLYSKEGRELDRLNLDTIIESYVTNLTQEYEDPSGEYEEEILLNEKEIELLKMLHSRDMDAEVASVVLHVSKIEFEHIVRKLLQSELLHYVSYNEIELTEEGIRFLSEKENEIKENTLV